VPGKSCFNFTKIDEGLFDELSAITAKGREMYAAQRWLATQWAGQLPSRPVVMHAGESVTK